MARFPSDRFRQAVIAGGEVRAVVELVRDGVVVASSETGEIVIEDGTYTFDLTRSINADLSLSLLIPSQLHPGHRQGSGDHAAVRAPKAGNRLRITEARAGGPLVGDEVIVREVVSASTPGAHDDSSDAVVIEWEEPGLVRDEETGVTKRGSITRAMSVTDGFERVQLPGDASTTGGNLGLDAMTGRVAIAARTTYLALLTAAPTNATTPATMVEVSAAGYARQSIAWSAPSGDPSTTSNTATRTFGPFTADPPAVTHCALVSSASGTTGDLTYKWLASATIDAGINDTIEVAVGALVAQLDQGGAMARHIRGHPWP